MKTPDKVLDSALLFSHLLKAPAKVKPDHSSIGTRTPFTALAQRAAFSDQSGLSEDFPDQCCSEWLHTQPPTSFSPYCQLTLLSLQGARAVVDFMGLATDWMAYMGASPSETDHSSSGVSSSLPLALC
ncbi:hypothetical protein SRHO_G00095650 [Serrasalmus rhombeus]